MIINGKKCVYMTQMILQIFFIFGKLRGITVSVLLFQRVEFLVMVRVRVRVRVRIRVRFRVRVSMEKIT